jgi:hypothetical protein
MAEQRDRYQRRKGVLRRLLPAAAVAVFVVVSVVVVLGVPGSTVHACSCMTPPAVQHRLGSAKVAFTGTAVSKERRTLERPADLAPDAFFESQIDVYTVRVSQLTKGQVAPVLRWPGGCPRPRACR